MINESSECDARTTVNAAQNETQENGVPNKGPKNAVKRKRGRKSLRDKTAPRPPYSGYIRYLNDRREQFRAENRNLPFAEITKVLAAEWSQLPPDKKQLYLSAAEQERVKYVEELAAYRKTDAYKNFIQRKLNRKKISKKVNCSYKEVQEVEKEKPLNNSSNSVSDIPIFSEEFLNFNKARESELRYLRKTVIDQEQEVAVLDKHIENMNNGILLIMDITKQLEASCLKYEQYLNKLRSKFIAAFANHISTDNIDEPLCNQSIDNFVATLGAQLQSSTCNPYFVEQVKNTIANMDLPQF